MDLSTDSSNSGSNIVTLEPYIRYENNDKKTLEKKRESVRNDDSTQRYRKIEVLPGHNEVVNYEHFFILEFENGRNERLNVFKANREIVNLCGGQPKSLPQGNGSLLIETLSPLQGERLKTLATLDGHCVKCISHPTFNQSRGVIYASELLDIEEKEIEDELKSQGVVKVVRMRKRVGEQRIPLATLIITFDQCRLPNVIKAGWLSLKVKPYIPSQLRCYHCQMYGHLSQKCKEKVNNKPAVCANCGKSSHGVCRENPNCIHCGEAHPATSKSCIKFIFEKEIQAIRTMERVTFKEARKRALEKQIRPGQPFSMVLKKNLSNHTDEKYISTSNMKKQMKVVKEVESPIENLCPEIV
ncbi:uncharacterized protein [Palaemon carinicauda]|uniref:uncharacterized protein n=1 Tax=Palaemon carinicauda TaxID=392227 RepID=UPI0035B5D56B